MTPRTGRPPLQKTSRNQDINIRLTVEEKQKIQYCSDALEISRTDAIMKGIDLLMEKIKEK